MTTSASQIETYLGGVDPYEFERLVAKLWEKRGYRTEVTSRSQDRGIDIIAEQDNPIKQKILIQAKAYSEENKISSNEIRKYATLYRQEDDVDRVVLVTTSGFTTQAKELAQDLDVDAIDRENLIESISECEVDIGIEVEQSSQNNRESQSQNQTNQSKKSKDDDIEIGVPWALIGLVGSFLIIAPLYHGGILSEDATGSILLTIIIISIMAVLFMSRDG